MIEEDKTEVSETAKNLDVDVKTLIMILKANDYISIGWCLFLLFGLIGFLIGQKQAGLTVIVATCIVWAISKIIYNALFSLHNLSRYKKL